MTDEHQVTLLLKAASDGDSQAAADLLPLVYKELRALAEARMRKIPPGQTLQPTALVHEAYIRLAGDEDSNFENRQHFFFIAARAMRDILVEQARYKASLKRGGDRHRVAAENLVLAIDAPAEDLLALNEALELLEQEDPNKHRLVMLRFFAGLNMTQTADVLGIAKRTAEREWRFIKAKLHKMIAETGTGLNE